MTHRYVTGGDTPEGFRFREGEKIEGEFEPRLVQGRYRPVIDTARGPVVLDPANGVWDVCVPDFRIPLWEHGEVVDSRPIPQQHFQWDEDGPRAPERVWASVPHYLLIRRQLEAGRPHPGAEDLT